MNNKIVVFVGQSGTGKSRLMKGLRDDFGVPILCSYTTRAPRDGEIDGDDYRFVTREEMDSLELLERVEYANNVYGTPKALFDNALATTPVSVIAMNIDGAKLLKSVYGDNVMLILLTMPFDVRKKLLEKRDGVESAKKRLANEDPAPKSSDADFELVLPNNGHQWKQIRAIVEEAIF